MLFRSGTCDGLKCLRCMRGYILENDFKCTQCNIICGNLSKCDGTSLCTNCRNDLYGNYCEFCDSDKFMASYKTDKICIDCIYSPCMTCNGTTHCTSCPEGIIGDQCNQCLDRSKFISNRECVDCSLSPCGSNGICDGTNFCICGSQYCCGLYDGYFY